MPAQSPLKHLCRMMNSVASYQLIKNLKGVIFFWLQVSLQYNKITTFVTMSVYAYFPIVGLL